MKKIFAVLLIGLCLPFSANAALVLTINTYTADELTFTISGTFDADSVGQYEGYLGVKNDWSNHMGVGTQIWSSVPDISGALLINGISAPRSAVSFPSFTSGDAFNWTNPATGGYNTPFTAGTTVFGTITATGSGIFDPLANDALQLVSGWNENSGIQSDAAWQRLEATGVNEVPLPAAAWLFGSGLIGLAAMKRKRS